MQTQIGAVSALSGNIINTTINFNNTGGTLTFRYTTSGSIFYDTITVTSDVTSWDPNTIFFGEISKINNHLLILEGIKAINSNQLEIRMITDSALNNAILYIDFFALVIN